MRSVWVAALLIAWASAASAEDRGLVETTPAGAQVVPSQDEDAGMLGEQELEALGLGGPAPSVNSDLKVSGFIDFTFGAALIPKSSGWRAGNVAANHPSFWIGNFNVYLSKYLYKWLYTLGEVRFTYLPNGSSDFGSESRQDTTTSDYADYGRSTRWGGVIIERVVLDFIAHPALTIRIGQFLTPYGVWNVDHGSPTYIPARRPWIIGIGWIPQRQTGIEVFGNVDVSSYGMIGYHLTLSNGTGPVSEYADLDDNKALGARLYWEYLRLGRLRAGASAYYGRDTNVRQELGAGASIRSVERLVSQYDNLTFAADVVWTLGGLHLQSEWLVHQRAHTRKGRRPTSDGAVLTGMPADNLGWGGYVLCGYRFAWLGVMPYVVFERAKGDLRLSVIDLYSVNPGLNVRPVENLTLKAEFNHVMMLGGLLEGQALRQLQLQVAWAF